MATFEIKMPKLGESVTEGTIISWSVKIGDQVNEDEVLFEVSTAKVSAEIPSPVAGKVFKILFNEGDTVTVGTTVAIIQLEGSEEEIPDNNTAPQEETGNATNANAVSSSTVIPKAQAAKEEERWYSPVVLQMAQEANLSKEEMDHIPGTGYMGRLSKKDMKDYLRKERHDDKTASPTGRTGQSNPGSCSFCRFHPVISNQRRQDCRNGSCRPYYRGSHGIIQESFSACYYSCGSRCHQTGTMAYP